MATQRQKRKAINKAKKVAKKNPTILIIIILILLVIAGIFAYLYFSGKLDSWFKKNDNGNSNQASQTQESQSGEVKEDGVVENIVYENFQIHFLELGNEYAGDSTYIKVGDVDILIDAGSRFDSATTINEYVKNYCTDGKLEYVIATHAHQDHIAGFSGSGSSKYKNFKGETVEKTGVLYYFDVGTLIDFTYYGEKENKNEISSSYGSGTVYGKYLAAREYLIDNGTTYYTAKDLWDNNKTTFTLADGITMDILYNYYYFNKSSDENNYSVCTMFNYNNHHYMLTGDLEKEGEEKLSEYYDGSTTTKTLPECDLFKAGHHGSKTSSNECLLKKIKPKMCCVCCCAGTPEYTNNLEHQFPTQAFINRIAQYTSRVYVTSTIKYIDDEWKLISMNGNIIVSSNGIDIGLKASNNLIKLKDTEWFSEKIYAVKTKSKYVWNEAGDSFDVYENSSGTKPENFYTKDTPNAVLVPRRTWPSNGIQ